MKDYTVQGYKLVKCPTCNHITEVGKWICLPINNAMFNEYGYGHQKENMFFYTPVQSVGL